MEANLESRSIVIQDPRHHAVAMTALMHGLRLYRIDPSIRAELEESTIEKAREERQSMLEQGYGTKTEYTMSFEAAQVAMMGFKRIQEIGINAGSAEVRIARHNIGNRFAEQFNLLVAPEVSSPQIAPIVL